MWHAMINKVVIGVNDPRPTIKPNPGMEWIRMKGGPNDGQWVQKKNRGAK